MSLSADDVREILRLLEESTFDELVLETETFKLALRRGAAAQAAPEPLFTSDGAPALPEPPRPPAVSAPAPEQRPAAPGVVDVTAPLLGIFYRAPKPDSPPFVEVGQRVEPDTVIALIEVMKLMNTVRAGVSGEVVEICAENGVMVEYEEVLIRVRVE